MREIDSVMMRNRPNRQFSVVCRALTEQSSQFEFEAVPNNIPEDSQYFDNFFQALQDVHARHLQKSRRAVRSPNSQLSQSQQFY